MRGGLVPLRSARGSEEFRSSAERRAAAIQFALTYAVYCAVYLERKPVSVVKPMLVSELGLGTRELAWVDSAFLGAYALGQLSIGTARSVMSAQTLVAASLVASGACTAVCGSTNSAAGLATFWGLNGLFQAALNPLLVLYVADLFPAATRASAVGAWQTSQQVGGVTANLFAAHVVKTAGWRPIFWRAGAIAAASALPFVIASSARAKAKVRWQSNNNRLDGDGNRTSNEMGASKLRGVKAVAAAYFLIKMTRYCLVFWLPFFLVRAAKLELAEAAKLASLFDVGGAFGAVAVGLVADQFFFGAMLTACAPFAAATALFLLIFASTYQLGRAMVAACMLAVGFCVAAPDGVLGGAAARNLCDYNRRSADLAPAVSGLVNGCGSVGAIAQGMGTAALVHKAGWSGLFISLAAFMTIATTLLIPAINLERSYLNNKHQAVRTP